MRRAPLAALLWLWAALALAEEPLPLFVEIDATLATLTEAERAQLLAAIASELGATLLDAPADGVATLVVARTSDGQARLTLRQNPLPVERTLPWSSDPAAAARDVALMAQNLVRDQTSDLLAAPVAPVASEPAAPDVPAPPPAQAEPSPPLDAELPPDFKPKPLPSPARPTPRNRSRLWLLATYAPAVGLPVNVQGEKHSANSTLDGIAGRFDLPLTARLSAGGGFSLAKLHGNVESQQRMAGVNVTAVMNATASLRAHTAIGRSAEVYALAGAGPSFSSNLFVDGLDYAERTARPYLGFHSALFIGTSLVAYRNIAFALELGFVHHFLHGREATGSRLEVHTVHLTAQAGVMWSFDAP